MKAIGDILQRHNVGTALARGVSAAQIVEKANDLLAQYFGVSIQNQAEAAFVKQRTLTIICKTSVVSQEIRFKEQGLLLALQSEFGAEAPTRVRYRVELLPSAAKYSTL